MPLDSQRFRTNATLTSCVDQGYRMMRDEPDVDAVKRLQLALSDLGYIQVARVDGIWGDKTSAAVVEFKTQEQLEPNDPVASRGTIGQLDRYFAWEPDDPNDPDPSATDLNQFTSDRMTEAATAINTALGIIAALRWGEPDDGSEAAARAALLTHRGIDVAAEAFPASRTLLDGLLTGMRDTLLGDEITIEALDQAGWEAVTGYSFTSAVDFTLASRRLRVTPSFRNVLPPLDRLATLLRIAARTVDADMHALGYPGTARYGFLSAGQKVQNTVSIAALILFLADGPFDVLHPPPVWGDLTSFPGP